MPSKSNKQKNLRKNTFFLRLEGQGRKQQEPHWSEARIRIRTIMSRIHNTGTWGRKIRTSFIFITFPTYLKNGLHQGDRLPRPWRPKDDVGQRSTFPRQNPVEKVLNFAIPGTLRTIIFHTGNREDKCMTLIYK